jgi:hypothetical protein
MALTITDTDAGPPQAIAGGRAGYKAVVKTVAFDSSYPNTGGTVGEPLSASDLGLSTALFVVAQPTAGYVFEYDYSASTLKAFYGDNNNASDGPLIQVPNTTDLSAVTGVRIFAVGT